jgi:hypothetical protein
MVGAILMSGLHMLVVASRRGKALDGPGVEVRKGEE